MDLVYLLLTLTMGGYDLLRGAIFPGVAGIVGPTLCCLAASSLRRSFATGTSQEKIGGLGAALTFVTVGVGLVYYSGYWAGLFGYPLAGVAWCAIGLAAGWTAAAHPPSKQSGAQAGIIGKPAPELRGVPDAVDLRRPNGK